MVLPMIFACLLLNLAAISGAGTPLQGAGLSIGALPVVNGLRRWYNRHIRAARTAKE